MAWARRALAPIAAIWLVCQAATLALVPTVFEAGLAECVCANGADATCPMHHKTAGAKVCAMQSATTTVPAPLNALLSVPGLLPAAPQMMVPVSTASPVLFERSMLTRRPSPPDPPPPRS